MDTLKRAEIDLEKEMDKWIDLTLGALAIAFTRYWGWGVKRISNVMDEIQNAWDECAETNTKSMIQMLEEETGVELRSFTDNRGWRELAFLNNDLSKKINVNGMTKAQWVVMRRNQIKWMRPQIYASALLGLHRRYGFGYERLARLVGQIDDVIAECDYDKNKLLKVAYEEAHFVMKGKNDEILGFSN